MQKLLDVLQRLVERGNTVVVIEHNLDVIKSCDWLIDLGPEGGDAGGEVVAAGTPEAVAGDPASYTGRYLAPLLEREPLTAPPAVERAFCTGAVLASARGRWSTLCAACCGGRRWRRAAS